MSIADYSRQIYPHCPPTSTSVPGEDGNETAGCQPDQGGTTSGTKSPFRRGAPPYPSQFASHRYHGSTGDSTLCTSGTGEGILLLPLLPARAFGPADDQPVRGPVRCGCIHHRAGRPEAPGDHGSGTPPVRVISRTYSGTGTGTAERHDDPCTGAVRCGCDENKKPNTAKKF